MTENNTDELKHRIINFLREFKTLTHEQGLILKGRAKNQEGFRDSGHTQKTFSDDILSLGLSNYCEGPISDDQHLGEYWVFGKQIARAEFYIKVKIASYDSGRREAICLSFHRAAWALTYPFKK